MAIHYDNIDYVTAIYWAITACGYCLMLCPLKIRPCPAGRHFDVS